uniref:OCEL domain-containing protein n=1 Tax=Timema bartmani TaxID=61472 RepID=A0A7R9I4Y2_9NEOP|nr:unnamed protein product [Timema bartmani]
MSNTPQRLAFPSTESSHGQTNFTFSLSSNSDIEGPQGSFECIQQSRSKVLELLGAVPCKMRIQAKEDAFETTRNRVAVVEENYKKNCTREIKPGGPGIGRRVKVKTPLVGRGSPVPPAARREKEPLPVTTKQPPPPPPSSINNGHHTGWGATHNGTRNNNNNNSSNISHLSQQKPATGMPDIMRRPISRKPQNLTPPGSSDGGSSTGSGQSPTSTHPGSPPLSVTSSNTILPHDPSNKRPGYVDGADGLPTKKQRISRFQRPLDERGGYRPSDSSQGPTYPQQASLHGAANHAPDSVGSGVVTQSLHAGNTNGVVLDRRAGEDLRSRNVGNSVVARNGRTDGAHSARSESPVVSTSSSSNNFGNNNHNRQVVRRMNSSPEAQADTNMTNNNHNWQQGRRVNSSTENRVDSTAANIYARQQGRKVNSSPESQVDTSASNNYTRQQGRRVNSSPENWVDPSAYNNHNRQQGRVSSSLEDPVDTSSSIIHSRRQEGRVNTSPEIQVDTSLTNSHSRRQEGRLNTSPEIQVDTSLTNSHSRRQEGRLNTSPEIQVDTSLTNSHSRRQEGRLNTSPEIQVDTSMTNSHAMQQGGGQMNSSPDELTNISLAEPAEYPDYLTVFTTITNSVQRGQYKAHFNADYTEYRELHAIVEKVSRRFAELEERLKHEQHGGIGYMLLFSLYNFAKISRPDGACNLIHGFNWGPSGTFKLKTPGLTRHSQWTGPPNDRDWGSNLSGALKLVFHSPSTQMQRIKQLIVREYQEKKKDRTYQDATRRFTYLHEKLSHIKRLVLEYDTHPQY